MEKYGRAGQATDNNTVHAHCMLNKQGYIHTLRIFHVVCFPLCNSPASEFYMPTFRNTLFHLHRQVVVVVVLQIPAYEDGTDRVFRNVGICNSDVGELPRRKHTIYRTRRKFEIKNISYLLILHRKNSYENASQCYVQHIRSLHVLFLFTLRIWDRKSIYCLLLSIFTVECLWV